MDSWLTGKPGKDIYIYAESTEMYLKALICLICGMVYLFETIQLPLRLSLDVQRPRANCCHTMTGKTLPDGGGGPVKNCHHGKERQPENDCTAICSGLSLIHI